MKKRQIRNYLIKRKMQMRITLRFLLLAMVSSFLSGLIVFITLWPVVSGFVPRALISHIQSQILFRLCCYSLPLIVIITGLGLIITHPIAGVVYKIEQKLDQLLQGNHVESIQVRKGDELKELVAKINALIRLLPSSEDLLKKKHFSK
jgi:hypothetical protein